MNAAVASLVPTQKTRALMHRMIAAAERTTGPDAAALLLDEVDPDQMHALVGALLTAIRPRHDGTPGRPRIPDLLTETEMRTGYSLYQQGLKTPFTRAAKRQYQRQHRRAARACAATDTTPGRA